MMTRVAGSSSVFLLRLAARLVARRVGLEGDDDDGDDALGPWVCSELERLGPAYVKVGQLLAMQGDLPLELTEALQGLQDRASNVPFSRIIAGSTHLLPQGLTDVVEQPIAAASLGVVYVGRWDDGGGGGSDVAIKVLRPGIRRELAANLWSLSRFLRRFSPFSESANHLLSVVRRYRLSIWSEIDYIHEAASSLELARSLERIRSWNRVPRVLHVNKEFLVMEYVPGIRVTDVEGVRAAGLCPVAVADNLLEAFLHQCLVSGVFHSDPHPGNVSIDCGSITRPPSFVWYDCGSITRCDGSWRSLLVELSIAIAKEDVYAVAEKLERMGIIKADKRSKRAVVKFVRVLVQAQGASSKDPAGGSVDFVGGMRDILGNDVDRLWMYDLREAFVSDSKYVLLGKSVLTVNASCVRLDPGFNLIQRSTPLIKRFWGPAGTANDDESASVRTNIMEEILAVAKNMTQMPGRVTMLEERLREIDGDSVDRHQDMRVFFTMVVVAQLVLYALL
jgi:predicted unusual protein kinase regulating ubiquinone biosynthesis (AarF/ABC1/UbiB family)